MYKGLLFNNDKKKIKAIIIYKSYFTWYVTNSLFIFDVLDNQNK
jgi:hypothetical protein